MFKKKSPSHVCKENCGRTVVVTGITGACGCRANYHRQGSLLTVKRIWSAALEICRSQDISGPSRSKKCLSNRACRLGGKWWVFVCVVLNWTLSFRIAHIRSASVSVSHLFTSNYRRGPDRLRDRDSWLAEGEVDSKLRSLSLCCWWTEFTPELRKSNFSKGTHRGAWGRGRSTVRRRFLPFPLLFQRGFAVRRKGGKLFFGGD